MRKRSEIGKISIYKLVGILIPNHNFSSDKKLVNLISRLIKTTERSTIEIYTFSDSKFRLARERRTRDRDKFYK